jgi:CRP/FNR family transcriptional regulator, dissimilatory nitrate respiration regulator
MTTSNLQLNIPALLARIPLFAGLDTEEIKRISANTREVAVARGEALFHRGDKADGFYIVVYGQMKLAFTSPQGSEKVVEIIGPGQSFGEAVMFMDKPYPVMAQALADAQLLHIGRGALFNEIDHDPRLARKMIAGLSMRLHRLIADVESYSLHSARERVIGYLLREAPDDERADAPYDIHLPTSKGTLASRLNITQEHFSRLLHDLSERGLIEVSGRSIHVPSVEKLRSFSSE